MVQAGYTSDEKALRDRLESFPDQTRRRCAVIVAYRAAMRVLPLPLSEYSDAPDATSIISPDPLTIFRRSLLLETYISSASPAVKKVLPRWISDTIFSDVGLAHPRSGLSRAGRSALGSAFDAARCAVANLGNVADIAVAAVRASANASTLSVRDFVQDDMALLAAGDTPRFSPLWMRLEPPGEYDPAEPPYRIGRFPHEFSERWQKAHDWLTAQPGHDFWIRWYEAALQGRPLTGDWETHDELLTDIALIPDEDWEKGAEHIAALIAEIEARHRLLAETRRLKTELAPMVTAAAAAPIGHNHPPEPLNDAPLPQQLTIIWAMLDNAELELSKPKPDKSVLRKIGTSLKNAAIAIARYCGLKADKALDKAVETLGATVGKGTAAAIVAKLAGLDDAVLALANAIKTFAGP